MVDALLLIRHGETEWSTERRHTGRTDIALTDRGRAEAAHIAGAVGRFAVAHAFCSPLARARDTAALIGLDATVDDDLIEWDYGVYEGRTTADIRTTEPGWTVWTHPVTGGETIAEVAVRADHVIGRVLELDGTVALVAHAHLLRVLGARWLDLPAVEGRRLVLDTATLSVLGWERENRAILRWNDPCVAEATSG